ncbi:MAG: glycosyltransferase family 4 protein [Gammaproteobacteria bacterium]
MRLLVITHAGGSPYHGPNTRWYYLARALREFGVQSHIVSSSTFHKYFAPPKVNRAFETEVIDGIEYHWVRTGKYTARGAAQVRNQFQFVAGCYRHKREIVALKPDLVVASSPHPFVVYPAASVSRKLDIPLIYEVRDLWPQVLLELGGYSRFHPYMVALRRAERYAVRRANRLISVKPGDLEYFAGEYGLPESRFSYIPNGFLPDEVSSAKPAPVVQQLRERYRFLIVYVGAISAYYQLGNLTRLAKLVEQGGEIGVMVVGAGDRAQALEAEAASAGLTNFHMVGAIPKSKVPATLALADACYVGLAELPVNRYGISCNKIYEYMFAGKPILGSYSVGYDPIAAAGCGVTAPPGGEAQLALAVQRWMRDPAEARQIGARGREYFDRHHDFRIVAEKLHEEVLCTPR